MIEGCAHDPNYHHVVQFDTGDDRLNLLAEKCYEMERELLAAIPETQKLKETPWDKLTEEDKGMVYERIRGILASLDKGKSVTAEDWHRRTSDATVMFIQSMSVPTPSKEDIRQQRPELAPFDELSAMQQIRLRCRILVCRYLHDLYTNH